jgi:hypothetical protein
MDDVEIVVLNNPVQVYNYSSYCERIVRSARFVTVVLLT